MKDKKRILISENLHAFRDFENSVESIQNGANELIQIFESFQPWDQIKTLAQFEELVSDPAGLFDRELLKHSGIDIKLTGKQPNPARVAEYLDIDRENFQNLVTGRKVTEGCKPCKGTKISKPGSGVLNFTTYNRFRAFLIFDNCRFRIDEKAVSEKKESFRVYIETPEQIKVYEFWHGFENSLNALIEKGIIDNPASLQAILKNRFMYSYKTERLHLNMEALQNEILTLNPAKV